MHCSYAAAYRYPVRCARRTFFSSLGSDHNASQQYHERKILPYRRHQLYNIVADVDAYHLFIPYCTASRVLSRVTKAGWEGGMTLRAELKVGFMGFEERYVSDVECRPYELVQAVAATDIPLFKSLTTTWGFHRASCNSPHPTADLPSTLHPPAATAAADDKPTLVTFDLQYAFASPLHARLSAAFFGQVSQMMIRAFERRCLEVYGPGVR